MNRKTSSGRGLLRSLLVHHKHRQSLHHKIRNTFVLMIIIPFFTVAIATAIVGRVYFGKSFSPGPNHIQDNISIPRTKDIKRLNTLLEKNPENLFKDESLSVFFRQHPRQFAVSYINGVAKAISGPMTLELFKAQKEEKIKGKERYIPVWEWSFSYSDNNNQSLESDVLNNVKIVFFEDRSSRPRGPFWFLLSLVIFMITVNSVATHRVSKHITRPLEKLEKAAVRIGDGDLDFSLKATGAEEVTRLFCAFEEMRKQLKSSLEKQEAQYKSRKELIAAISHDLRTPITSIRGHVEGLKDGIPKTDTDRKRYLDIIENQALILDEMIHNLFLFSKLDIGEIPLHKEPVKFNDFISSVITDYLQIKFPAGKENNTPPDITINIPDTINCLLDKKQFKRVIENIIENSIMHNPGSGLSIFFTAVQDDTQCRIKISDNGIGINVENKERIFETMFQEDESRNREGSGLGLAIVEKLVKAHNGKVKAYNNTDGTSGLTVEIILFNSGDQA